MITEDSYIDYLSGGDVGALIPIALWQRLSSSSLLFLGYSLSDWNLRVILNRMWGTRKLVGKSWAVLLEPADSKLSKIEQTLWDTRENVELVYCELCEYVRELEESLPADRATSQRPSMRAEPTAEALRAVSRVQGPYVGLQPYDEADAAFFFGRSQESAIVAANLRSTKLTILYGPSGVGKSSLLMAGVVHGLREQARTGVGDSPFAVCVFRSWHHEPLSGLQESCRAALQDLAGEHSLAAPVAGQTLTKTLRAWTTRAGALLIVLDQFEEYFQYCPDDENGDRLTGFAGELAGVVNDSDLPVHVLLSIREDAWASLDRFEGHIDSIVC